MNAVVRRSPWKSFSALAALAAALGASVAACAVDSSEGDSSSSAVRAVDWTPPVKELYRQYDVPTDPYSTDTEPVLAGRCVVCHECVEAPCQLKLSSYLGLRRGTSKDDLFGARFYSLKPTRLKDEPNLQAWRERNYSPVVADDGASLSGDENAARSVLYQAIDHGRKTNAAGFDRSAQRAYYDAGQKSCPATVDEHREFLRNNPGAGMPLGLTSLAKEDFAALQSWIRGGAKGPSPAAELRRSTPNNPAVVARWEAFFNRPSAEARLVAQYLYQHVSELRFHFRESPGEYFELVRSRTGDPQSIDEILTEKTYNAPGTDTFFYRFAKVNQVRSKKTHIVWDVGLDELERIRSTFEGKPWTVPQGSKPMYTGNPFADFEAIPAAARDQFLLEHSSMIIDQMVRGPVCYGRAATYAIRDHFWVSFLDPKSDPSVVTPYLGRTRWVSGAKVGDPLPMGYSSFRSYQRSFEASLRTLRPQGLGLEDIWSGNGGSDRNALLTVFRHNASATVHHGWIGGPAPTLWILSYSNFERLYYDLVADYVPWEGSAAKLGSWEYMYKVRVEGEHLFLSLLPPAYREPVEKQWYETLWSWSGARSQLSEGRPSRTQISDAADPVRDLANQVRARFPKALVGADVDELHDSTGLVRRGAPSLEPYRSIADFEQALGALTGRSDRVALRFLPILSHVRVLDRAQNTAQAYTFVTNHTFGDYESPLSSNNDFRPERTTLSIFRGIEGGHSYLFFDVPLAQAHTFVRGIWEASTEEQWLATRERFAVHRNSSELWKVYDWFMATEYRGDPLRGALLDLNHYDRDEAP